MRRCAEILLLIGPLAMAARADNPAAIEFNRDVRPILSDKCFSCHGPDKSNRKTAMHFDTEEGAFTALNGGRLAIVRGDPAKSEIVRRITSEDKALRMPPAYQGLEKLSAREIELIGRWIEQGAKWQPHWSFIPVSSPKIREAGANGWARNPIDSFVLARLEREGLKPSPEA